MTITWTNERRKLSDLIPWERNPKTISKKHAKKLLEYWQRVGQFQTVAAGPDGSLYDGHQRLAVLLDALGPDLEIDVRIASRALTEQEREELVVAAHAGTTGQWNWDDLANWDAESLIEWGFDDSALDDWRRDVGGLGALLGSESYKPNESPKFSTANVMDEDVLKEKARLDNRFKENSEYIETICPHCAKEFYINKKDIK